MSLSPRLCLVLLFLVLPWRPTARAAAASVPAVGAESGTIGGRVQNVVTGQYLNRARVTLVGTDRVAYTDNFGAFHLPGVPAGPAVLEVFYTDLDVARVNVAVPAGREVDVPVNLTSVARYGQGGGAAVRLDAFVVASDRETDAQAIATNEQRFAPNLKNVMSTDSLGDVLGGSVGEFLKFLPGITADYDNIDIAGISVRGIGGGMTAITSDGAPNSNIWVSSTRSVDVRSMGLNDISRIELSKVPTPATAADSLGGAVNLVSKSAFERSGRELRYGLNFVGNHENLSLQRTPHSNQDHLTYKILPGANFDFTWPVSRTFGVVLAGMTTNVYNEQHFTRNAWSTTGSSPTGGAASVTNPFLQSYLLLDGPRNLLRHTLSAKADWKVAPNSVLSLGHTANRAITLIGALQYTFATGTTGTSTVAGGTPLTWSPTETRGATGRGTLTNNGTNQRADQFTDSTNLTYRYDDGRWRLELGLSRSASSTKRRYADVGFFYQAIATNRNPVRINFLGITEDKPGLIEVFDNANQRVDWKDISNLRGTTTNAADCYNRGEYDTGYVNLRRSLGFLPVPAAVQVGVLQRVQTLDMALQSINWTFNGPDGVSGATAPLQPYLMQVYRNMDSDYGFRDIQWMSPSRAFAAYRANPRLYGKTAAQLFAEENYRLDNSEWVREQVRAAYVQGEVQLFRNRLRILGGVRFEETTDDGQGALTNADAVWLRDASGAYVRTAAGARIRRPEAGAVNSLEQLRLTKQERAARTHRSYDGFYPSLHLTLNLTEDLLLRAAYAATYGRPNFTDIVPRTVATAADLDDDDPDPITGRGTLTIRNPALKPWTADNYDLSVEYYTRQGGILSAGVYRKDIRNFFGDSSRFATPQLLNELGLDQRYVNWNIVTKFNSGDATIQGAELSVRQSLRMLGAWGAPFTVFANANKLDLDGGTGASFGNFIPRSGNWGGTFSWKRVTFTARWNHRGMERRLPQAAFGPDGYEYYKARTTLDCNGSYQVSRRLSLAFSVNNVTNQPQTLLRYGSATPAYARQYQEAEYAIQMAVGLRGTF